MHIVEENGSTDQSKEYFQKKLKANIKIACVNRSISMVVV